MSSSGISPASSPLFWSMVPMAPSRNINSFCDNSFLKSTVCTSLSETANVTHIAGDAAPLLEGRGLSETPITAVTDFTGVSILLPDAHRPIFLGASSTSSSCFCIFMGKSPYPGEYRQVKYFPSNSFLIISSALAQTCSTAAPANASAMTAFAMSST